MARELARLDIDITALSEVHFAEQGSPTEDTRGYIFFLSGKNKDERRLSGVGFMIKTSITRKLQNLPVGHSDRLMTQRLPIQDNNFSTVFSVYVPTLQAETGVKEAFYCDLHNLLKQVDSKDKLFILRDVNVKVGRGFEPWKGVLDRYGIGNCNDNGRLLLEASRKLDAERHEAAKKTERAGSIPIILSPNLRLSKVQWGLRIKNRTPHPPTSMQELTANLPQTLVFEESAIRLTAFLS